MSEGYMALLNLREEAEEEQRRKEINEHHAEEAENGSI